MSISVFFQAEDGIRAAQESRGLGMCIKDRLKSQRLVDRLAVLEDQCERPPVPGPPARGGADQQYLDGLRASVGLPNPFTGAQSSRRGGGDPAGDKGGGGPGGNGGGGGNASVPGAPA